jgi:hypothetical protein
MLRRSSTAMRVVRGIHRISSDTGSATQPTVYTGLAFDFHKPLQVRELSNRSPTIQRKLSYLSRTQLHSCMFGILRDDSRIGTSGSDELATGSGPDLEVMDDGASRDRPQW